MTKQITSGRQTTTAIAALLAAIAVAFGAYAAHGLADRLEVLGYIDTLQKRIDWFETGARYQMVHALGALAAIALIGNAVDNQTARWVCKMFYLGTLLFCGSLYVMTFAPVSWSKLGAITPLGGLSFIVGWLILAVSAFRHKPSK